MTVSKIEEDCHTIISEMGAEINHAAAFNRDYIILDVTNTYELDPELTMVLLDNPRRVLEYMGDAAGQAIRMRNSMQFEEYKKRHNSSTWEVRPRNLILETPLRRVGAQHVGKLIQLRGVVLRASKLRPLITKAAFICPTCGHTTLHDQDSQFIVFPEERCDSCRTGGKWVLNAQKSHMMDTQVLTVQESSEDLPPGQMPRSLNIELQGSLVDSVKPGERVIATGFLQAIQKSKSDPSRVLEYNMRGLDVDVQSQDLDTVEITDTDAQWIRELARNPGVINILQDSICPSVYGYEGPKKAILSTLFGGVAKESDDMRTRGNVNTFFCGDPGTAKSQMLIFAVRAAPRGLFTVGRGSTAAGLTAAVVKDDQGFGYTLEAGALVLADRGLLAVDELDKMREEDRTAIHPAMEQQVVNIAKAGIVAELNARASVLAAANPATGRYNPYQTVTQNIKLPITLLSRFDLIFIFKDQPDRVKDGALADHILSYHRGDITGAPLKIEELRKYVAYARRYDPQMTSEAVDALKEFYVKVRTASLDEKDAAIAITPRQLESAIRISESFARAEFSSRVEARHAELAIALLTESLNQVGIDPETGRPDIDAIMVGLPRSEQQRVRLVEALVKDMMKDNEERRAYHEDLEATLVADYKLSSEQSEKAIQRALDENIIYQPRATEKSYKV